MYNAKIVKEANDAINSDKKIKEIYPYVKEIYIEPLGDITFKYHEGESSYDFNDCRFHVHLTVPFSEFYKEFIKLYKTGYFKNKILSPVYELLFDNYRIDIDFLIDYYISKVLKQESIFYNLTYIVNIYSSDGKEITQINKVFSK